MQKNNSYFFVGSDVLDEEMDNITDPIKKQNVLNIYSFAKEHIELNPTINEQPRSRDCGVSNQPKSVSCCTNTRLYSAALP